MSYLLDKKIKRKKFLKIAFSILFLVILIYFRSGIFNKFSYIAEAVFRPVLILGHNVGGSLSNAQSYFYSKSVLLRDNENLKLQLNEKENLLSNYNSVFDENVAIKEILGRKTFKGTMLLAAILSGPNQSLYDTLIIDAGEREGIVAGEKVFALGNIPVGRIAEVYQYSSKVILFSTPGEKTEVIVGKPARPDGRSGGHVFMQVVGRGGGNFEMILLKDFVMEKGMEVILPGINPSVLARVETIISDSRDPFQKALLVSPVNIWELKFVEVEK